MIDSVKVLLVVYEAHTPEASKVTSPWNENLFKVQKQLEYTVPKQVSINMVNFVKSMLVGFEANLLKGSRVTITVLGMKIYSKCRCNNNFSLNLILSYSTQWQPKACS